MQKKEIHIIFQKITEKFTDYGGWSPKGDDIFSGCFWSHVFDVSLWNLQECPMAKKTLCVLWTVNKIRFKEEQEKKMVDNELQIIPYLSIMQDKNGIDLDRTK